MKLCTLIALFGVIACQHHSALAQPSAAQLLSEIGWSAADQQRVLNGEFVTKEDAESSDKDLALSIAFLVKTTPADLSEQILAGRLIGGGVKRSIGRRMMASKLTEIFETGRTRLGRP